MLKRIVLRLARNPQSPAGDDRQGYVLIAPLDDRGKIDLESWRTHKAACTVNRFHPDPAEQADGWLTHRGSQWRFRYDEDEEGPDEAGYHLGDHVFRPGEYVTLQSHGDTAMTYIVTEVTKA